jgi:hypothetical protein
MRLCRVVFSAKDSLVRPQVSNPAPGLRSAYVLDLLLRLHDDLYLCLLRSLGPRNRTFVRRPLRAREHTHLVVADEVNDDHRPARVAREVVVELGRERAEGREARPWYGREVVMLVVVADL